jgi:hypothetical protein
MCLLQDFNEPSTSLVRKVLSTCIEWVKYVERTEPDVLAAYQKVDKVVEENKANEERIKVLRREYETACDNKDAEELVGFSLACCVVMEASVD